MINTKGGGRLGEAVRAANKKEGGRGSITMIYLVVHPYPPSLLIPPTDNDYDNEKDDDFGNVVLFLDATISQSMKNI